MNVERLKLIEEIYHAALEIESPKRESFFIDYWGADVNLRREVESLLSFEEVSGHLLDSSPDSPPKYLPENKRRPISPTGKSGITKSSNYSAKAEWAWFISPKIPNLTVASR